MGFRTAEESDLNAHATESGHAREPRRSTAYGKRTFDILASSAILIVTAPLLMVVAILIRFQDGHSALFAQERIGKNGRRFRCYKLRTMVPDAQAQLERLLETSPKARAEWEATQKLEDDPRITSFGQFLRKSSIDELPQLFNVLRGDMSLVGPRPIVETEVARYGRFYSDYCSVQPGITGLWQIMGRSDTTYQDRVVLDVKYARSHSLAKDIAIVFKTIPAVLFSRGAR